MCMDAYGTMCEIDRVGITREWAFVQENIVNVFILHSPPPPDARLGENISIITVLIQF